MLRLTSSPSRSRAATDDRHALLAFIQAHATAVPYVTQSFSWDCGIACAEMALRARGVPNTSSAELRRLCPNGSVWTIDIAYLLTRLGLRTEYCTITVGVRPEYRKQEFYRKQLSEDTRRVTRLFDVAAQHGVVVAQRRVKIAEIRRALRDEKKLALVLMDKRFLRCSMCEQDSAQQRGRSRDGRSSDAAAVSASDSYAGDVGCGASGFTFIFGRGVGGGSGGSFWPSSSDGFLGHYVLLYAYHKESDSFLLKDPAAHRDTCAISADTLEAARLAFGTDQDILFIGGYQGDSGHLSEGAS